MDRRRVRDDSSEIQRHTTDLIFVTIFIVALSSWVFGVLYVNLNRRESFPTLNTTSSTRRGSKTLTPSTFNPLIGRKKRHEVNPYAKCFKYTRADRLSCILRNNLFKVFKYTAIFSISLLVSATIILHGSKHLIRIVELNLILFIVIILYYILERKTYLKKPYKCACEDFETDFSLLLLIFSIITLMFLFSRSGQETVNKTVGYISDLFLLRYIIMVGSLHMTVIIFIVMSTFRSLAGSSLKSIFFYIISISCVYLINFTCYFGRATISLAYISWKHSNHKSDFTLKQTIHSISTIGRYHLGTVAFSATFILPMWVALYFVRRHNFRKHNSLLERTLDVVLMSYSILDNAEYSILITSMFGHNFFESSKVLFQIFSTKVWKSFRALLIHHIFHILNILTACLFNISILIVTALGYNQYLRIFSLTEEPAQVFWSNIVTNLLLIGIFNNITRDAFLQAQFIYSSKRRENPLVAEEESDRVSNNEVAETQLL